jgi:hypothetical protein
MIRTSIFWLVCFVSILGKADAQTLPSFDFTKSSAANEWIAAHDLAPLQSAPEGLVANITGADPYMHGPARDYPSDQPLWMIMRLKSDRGGNAQIFFFQGGPSEDKSVHFFVPAGDWTEMRVPLPSLESRTRLRFDPPGTSGTCIVAKISFEPRPIPVAPAWPKPEMPMFDKSAPSIASGEISLVHGNALGAFEVRVNGQRVAIGNSRSLMGYTVGTSNRWIELTNATRLDKSGHAITAIQSFEDLNGGHWQIAQKFWPAHEKGAIEVETTVSVDLERSVISLPLFTLLPGVGAFGTNKSQAVFAGLEYLENEPSSSEKDVIGPGSRRKVPDALKVTFPLMAIAANNAYVGLIWEQDPQFSALFDSPDRTFNSGGHAMGVLFPGSNPALREDGALLPYGGVKLQANNKLVSRVTIIGGRENTIIPAVQEYVKRKSLPGLPNTGYTAREFFALEAHGWLDSKIRDGAKFRHAVGNNFGSAAVADAPMYMDWLAANVSDQNLSSRLRETANSALSLVEPQNYNAAAVGHIRHPVESLVYGSVAANAKSAAQRGRGQLAAFGADGSIQYHAPAKGLDLGKTHSSREANGLTATHVADVLQCAAFSGNKDLIREAIRLLRGLDKFRGTVPRGAQTWEVPLHTPDILGSAYLVRAYVLGYELTGEPEFLAQAKYWAWTGVPFIYLTPPTSAPVGVYSTTPVFGATQFVAPLWIGLPVQWCGLVYGDAIRQLARFDKKGPWQKLADGIAAAGVQHTHTASEPDFQGLLPDSYDLRAQNRNPVPINPATLLPEAIQFYGSPAIYDFKTFLNHRILAHSPGPITDVRESKNSVRFRANGWPKQNWFLLMNGFEKRPTITLDGKLADFQFEDGRAILQLTGPAVIEVAL